MAMNLLRPHQPLSSPHIHRFRVSSHFISNPILRSKYQLRKLGLGSRGGMGPIYAMKGDDYGECLNKGEVGKNEGEGEVGAVLSKSEIGAVLSKMLNGIENPFYFYLLIWVVKLLLARDPLLAKYLPVVLKCSDAILRVWFLMMLKSNAINHWMSTSSMKMKRTDLDRVTVFDQFVSIALLIAGLFTSVKGDHEFFAPFVTIGSFGGVLGTVTTASDALKNLSGGLFIHLLNIFRVGDSIKVGTIEGKVVSVGLIETTLLDKENMLVVVPNSKLFPSEGVTNYTCVPYKSFLRKVYLESNDSEMIGVIIAEIENNMKKNELVLLTQDHPCCCLSDMGKSYAELTIRYKLPNTDLAICKGEQSIIMETARVLQKHGVIFGSPKGSHSTA